MECDVFTERLQASRDRSAREWDAAEHYGEGEGPEASRIDWAEEIVEQIVVPKLTAVGKTLNIPAAPSRAMDARNLVWFAVPLREGSDVQFYAWVQPVQAHVELGLGVRSGDGRLTREIHQRIYVYHPEIADGFVGEGLIELLCEFERFARCQCPSWPLGREPSSNRGVGV